MQGITIGYLQKYLKSKDHNPELKHKFFLKLSEEVGELANAILRNPKKATEANIEGTIEEEIWDIMYYCLVLANCYDIDMEKWIPIKEKQNNERWNNKIIFNPTY